MTRNKLAVHGGLPAYPNGLDTWPITTPEILQSVQTAMESGDWGKYESEIGERLLESVRQTFHVEHVLPCSSGTVAVEIALRGVGVRRDDEVLLAGYDFPGNFRAIEAIGATPVLIDVCPKDWLMDLNQIDAAISSQTKAILVSHLHGRIADLPAVEKIAERHGVAVVEDACQVPGGQLDQRPLGSFGCVSALSFGGSKLLSAGRGGAVLTQDESILQRAKIFGSRGNEAFPLSQLQSAVLLPQMESLADFTRQRLNGWEVLLGTLGDHPMIYSTQPSRFQPAFYKVPLRIPNASRDRFIDAALAEGISLGEGFRGFASRSPRRCRKPFELPHSKLAASETVLLHHPTLLQSKDELEQLGGILIQIFDYAVNHPS